MRTGARRPVPEPPQLRQGVRRVPEQARQPVPSPSDHRVQRRHSSRPDPPHVAHRGALHRSAAAPPAGLLPRRASASMELFAIATPASIPSPADATAIGATTTTITELERSRKREREREGNGWFLGEAGREAVIYRGIFDGWVGGRLSGSPASRRAPWVGGFRRVVMIN
ncbi:hypothetical protein ABZP36_007034 [Zizania latifolia]